MTDVAGISTPYSRAPASGAYAIRETSVSVTANVEPSPIDPRRLEPLIGLERVEALTEAASALRALLGDRRIVNVNSTATGGGVAEMLATLLGYVRGIGLDADWLVITGDPEFFTVTKRIHNGLYGSPGDGGALGTRERATYERTIATNLEPVRREVRSGDVVIVHDPQPAGLIAPLVEAGAHVIWRCHVGYDGANEWTERAWAFIRPYVEMAHAHVFSRESFAPGWIDRAWLRAIPPSIDPFTPKNQELRSDEVLSLLVAAGLLAEDGREPDARLRHRADVVREGGPPDPLTPLVVQVSRWDRLKDMPGVLEGFARYVHADAAHLVLAGPAVTGVSDDPEGEEVWRETIAAWRALPRSDRSRVHLASVPMHDPRENAIVINALQRHSAVVVQKSLAEGFGLTVAEAMWKTRPVVATAVGGIVDQVIDNETGLLVDPHDLEAFGAAVDRLLHDRAAAERLAMNARRHIEHHFLGDRHLLQYADLLTELIGGA
jgi:trehalose synthase